MTPMQQMLLGVGAKKKTYMDDVFSTFLYNGTGSAQTINNGIDLSGEGGLVWTKSRSHGTDYYLGGPDLGTNKLLRSNSAAAEDSSYTSSLTVFNNNGFSLGTDGNVNGSGKTFASWSFRKSPMFDCVTWTGNSDTNQTISHSLKSIPGLIIAKRTDSSTYGDWVVYHRDHEGYLKLNSTAGAVNDSGAWTPVTSTSFKAYDYINVNGASYVAYVFAGGESTAATARSVDFDGSGDYLVVYNQADLSPEDGDFTCEMWIKPDSWSTGDSLVYASSSGFSITRDGSNNALKVGMAGSTTHLTSTSLPEVGQWTHVAVARYGTTMRLFFNGVLNKTETVSHNYASPVTMYIVGGGGEFNGKISNFRFVKGTAVYTSSFRPSTEPLANITNTKLLCCNGSSTNSSTVTPGTLNAEGNPTASTDSPFDDPAGFVFGDSKEGIIKCGSYVGDGNGGSSQGVANSQEIFLGWEPQWILIKRSSATEGWVLYDSMRGIVSSNADADARLEVNNYDTEASVNHIELTSTGFTFTTNNNTVNASGSDYIYLAIRRPDGYVGKPAEAGTNVFTMDTGSGSSTIPEFDSGFPVDFALMRQPGTAENWYTGVRLTGGKYLKTNTTDAEPSGNEANWVFDSNAGWCKNYNSDYQSWMWKRHAGFDVVTYKGNGTAGHVIPHNLSKVPEMIWCKSRDTSGKHWYVYVKGLNGGTNPEQYSLRLNVNNDEGTDSLSWNQTAPTSTHFTLGSSSHININNDNHIAMLFASVDGISKVGSFTNSGGTTTVSCGFQPRFIIVKQADATAHWRVYDTIRGINAGGEPTMNLNDDSVSATHTADDIDINSDGFTIPTSSSNIGYSGDHIFYAHA